MLIQYGVIPVRNAAAGGVEILLITSRDTGRWVVPRGNLVLGKSPAASAVQEAFEEAGVTGSLDPRPFGLYHYDKRRRRGGAIAAEVHLFLLRVEAEAAEWPEAGERERRWFAPEAAAALVAEPALAALIRAAGAI